MKKSQLILLIALFLAMKPVIAQSELAALEGTQVRADLSLVTDDYASAIPPDEVLHGRYSSPLRDNVVLMITGLPDQEVVLIVSNSEGSKVKEIHSFTNQKILWQTHHLPAGTYFLVIYVNGSATMMVKAAKEYK